MGPRRLICHHLGHAEAAFEAAARHRRALMLLTPAGAAGYGGPAYFQAMFDRAHATHPAARTICVLDCGDDAAMALFALDSGWQALLLRGHPAARRRVASIARQRGVTLYQAPPPAIDLAFEADPSAAIACALGIG